jgi:hypothetical protein
MKHNFAPFLNPVFIESGTYAGEGVLAAVKAGFPRIISIEYLIIIMHYARKSLRIHQMLNFILGIQLTYCLRY